MDKTYTSFKEIEQDLKKLNLQRKICIEELKLLKPELEEDFKPYQWVSTLFNAVKKYSIFYFIKRIFN